LIFRCGDEPTRFSFLIAKYKAYVWWRAQNSGSGTTLTTDDGLVNPNNLPNFYGYAIGQYAKFVRPGSVAANATYSPATGVYVSAYKGNGHYVIVAINENTSSTSVAFAIQSQTVPSLTPYQTTASAGIAQQSPVIVANDAFTYALPAESITTLVQSWDSRGKPIGTDVPCASYPRYPIVAAVPHPTLNRSSRYAHATSLGCPMC
jgi:O-glycosyl hydrolase